MPQFLTYYMGLSNIQQNDKLIWNVDFKVSHVESLNLVSTDVLGVEMV